MKFSLVTQGVFRIFVDGVNDGYRPALARRILSDKLGFYDDKYHFDVESEGVYIWDVAKLFDVIPLYEKVVFDIVLYREADESVKYVSFNEDVSLSDMVGMIKINEVILDFKICKYANGRLFVNVTLRPERCAILNSIEELDEGFKLCVEAPLKGEIKCLLARRGDREKNRKINATVELACEIQSDCLYINFPKNAIAQFVSSADEIWDFYISCEGKIYDLLVYFDFVVKNFDINSSFAGKLEKTEDKCLSLSLKEKTDNCKRIKVAILGSCFTKEAFHSLEYCNPEYKRFYENGCLIWHQSLIALMSPPLPFCANKFDDKTQEQACLRYGEDAFLKKDLAKLIQYKPNYLIIDNYTEAYASIFEDEQGGFVTDAYFMMNTTLIKEMNKKNKYHPSSPKRFQLYKKFAKEFLESIKEIIPETRIVLVKTHPATNKLVNGKLEPWEELDAIRFQSELWDKYDNYLLSVAPKIRVIDMRYGNYYSDVSPHLTFSRNHFNSRYYKDLLSEFNKIVLADEIKK